MRALLAALGDLVWPLSCGGCQEAGARWCPACAALLTGPAAPARPTPAPADLPPGWATAAYDGAVRQAIIGWKDGGRHDLTGVLTAGLTLAVRAALGAAADAGVGRADRPLWLVPMPSRPSARRARGADPIRTLATGAAAAVRREEWRVQVRPALRHRRAVADQAGLGAAERAVNLAGALEVRPGLAAAVAADPPYCLLVDDVMTTGATLAEAARTLTRAGAHPFGLAVVAATQRDHGRVSRSAGRPR